MLEKQNDEEIVALATRQVPTIQPEDSIGRAAELMRNGASPALPVLQNGVPVGLVTEQELRSVLAGALSNGVADKPVRQIMAVRFPTATLSDSRAKAGEQLQNSREPALVVTDQGGQYIGIVTAADLMSRPMSPTKPPLIGGMATPLGVYLTTGRVNSGAGPLGLALTGAILFSLFVFADLLVFLLAWALGASTGLPVIAWARSPYLASGLPSDYVGAAIRVLVIPVFLLLMRLLPLSGTHAAEHQVVHAVERGERLTLDVVRRMPRVHPRCGTNLAAGSMLFLTLAGAEFMKGWGDFGLLLALVLTVLFWRPFGNFVQSVATTKPATDKQLLNAIEVAKGLLKEHRRRGTNNSTFGVRLLNSGLPYVMVGRAVAIGLFILLSDLTGVAVPLIAR